MKKWIAILLCLLFLCGCSSAPEYQKPVTFYYLRSEMSYEGGSATIASEVREGTGMGKLEDIVRAYLTGPESADLKVPFPAGLKLVRIRQDETTVYITVSEDLASLTNLELTLACSCITLTCLELTGLEQVCIEAENSLLGGQKAITMDKNSLLLTDSSAEGE